MEKILVIEDDRSIQKALSHLFESEGFAVEVAENGEAGLAKFRATQPVLVVLDLKLPRIPGREVCREIKMAAPALPVIILSATSDEVDKVLLLEIGADDYVTKPFSPRELMARVHAVMRRSRRPAVEDRYTFDDVSIDFSRMEVSRGGRRVPLTAQEFKFLKYFVQNPERVLTRDEILNEVWGYDNYPHTRTVDNHVMKLRQKLEKDPATPIHFVVVHRAGYKFVP